MFSPWNLTPDQWSDVLREGLDPHKAAEELKSGTILPWTQVLLDNSKDSGSTLDLGSGRGENSALLAMKGKKTTLFDWSDKNLDFSRKLYAILGLPGTFIQGDMTQRLPFEDGSFDTVFTCGVLEYFNKEQIIAILKECMRVSRKRVIVMVPNAWSIFYQLGKWHLELIKKWQWGGERPFTTLRPHFEAANRNLKLQEFSVGSKHSVGFLQIPFGRTLQKVIIKGLRLTDHSRPSRLNQGYLLITIGEK